MTDLKQKLKDAILPEKEGTGLTWAQGYDKCISDVSARLDKLLKGVKVVKGWASNGEWFESPQALPESPSHQALLLMIEPIKKPKVTREEIVKYLESPTRIIDEGYTLAKRIKEDGIE